MLNLKLLKIIIITIILSLTLLIVLPYIPDWIYAINPDNDKPIQYSLSERTSSLLQIPSQSNLSQTQNKSQDQHQAQSQNQIKGNISSFSEGNWLLIPKIKVNTKILEGTSIDILNKNEGVWHDAALSKIVQANPLQLTQALQTDRSETHEFEDTGPDLNRLVLAGHRFQYLPPNTTTFYHLDKLNDDDKIVIIWEKQEYVYSVYQSLVIDPIDINAVTEGQQNNKDHKTNQNENILVLYTCTPIGSNDKRLIIKAKLIA